MKKKEFCVILIFKQVNQGRTRGVKVIAVIDAN